MKPVRNLASTDDGQAPKAGPPAAKQALILSWFQTSGVAHSIKDLEKALPSVASINGMQVKDYLQALSDDNKIRVEKIGSGNWYWSFPSDEKRSKEAALARAQEERDRAASAVADLEEKLEAATTAREEDESSLTEGGIDRKALTAKHAELARDVERVKEELARYSDSDPVEVERRKRQLERLKRDAERWTDHIQSLEGWLKEHMNGDKEQMAEIKRTYYGDQYNEEEDCLWEL